MNRGSVTHGRSGRRGSRSRFNEAPIHESGKFGYYLGRNDGKQGFNEAPIHESGKCDPVRNLLIARCASMRPRFMNRGSRQDDHGKE